MGQSSITRLKKNIDKQFFKIDLSNHYDNNKIINDKSHIYSVGNGPIFHNECLLSDDVREWLEENITGDYEYNDEDLTISFEYKKDAVLFKITLL